MSALRSLLAIGVAGVLGLNSVAALAAPSVQGAGTLARANVGEPAAPTVDLALPPGLALPSSSTSAMSAPSDPIPAPIRAGHIRVGLRTVAAGMVSPVAGAFAPGIENRLFVADQIGKIWSVDIGRHPGPKTLFADLTGLVVRLGDIIPGSSYDERGLLGLAFSPDYPENGLVYVYLTEAWSRPADFSTQPGQQNNCDAWLSLIHI